MFALVREASGASDDDLFSTFNMGLGMVVVAPAEHAEQILATTTHRAFRIGHVVAGAGVHIAD